VYFITLNVRRRARVLSVIRDGRALHTDAGNEVEQALVTVCARYRGVALDTWVIMPDHVHVVVKLGVDAEKGLHALIGMVKGLSARMINRLWDTEGRRFWQRGFDCGVVRTAEQLARVRQYVTQNPNRWPPT